MKFALAKKIGMTRIFDEAGICVSGTLLQVIPSKVVRTISEARVGYNAVVITNDISKSSTECEFRVDDISSYKPEQTVDASQFEVEDNVMVKAKSKGKGFAGAIKRHGFSRGPMSHGSNHHRAPGAIGGGYPQRVVLGRKMPGRLGGEGVTLKNLRVLSVDATNNIVLVSGSVPGPKKALIKLYAESKVKVENSEE